MNATDQTDFHIALTIDGLHADDKHVRLSVFISQLELLSSSLTRIDQIVSGGKRANHFRIIALSHSSPATVVIEPVQNEGMPDTRSLLVNRFTGSLHEIEQGHIPVDFDNALLHELKELARPAGESVESVAVSTSSDHVLLTKEFAARIEQHLVKEQRSIGTIEGALEQINIHSGANIFHVYPLVGPTKIRCHFSSELLDLAKQAVGRQVAVTGMLKYRPDEPFPYKMNVDSMDIYPPDNELPSLSDLFGKVPNLTSGLSSEQYIRELRDAWD